MVRKTLGVDGLLWEGEMLAESTDTLRQPCAGVFYGCGLRPGMVLRNYWAILPATYLSLVDTVAFWDVVAFDEALGPPGLLLTLELGGG